MKPLSSLILVIIALNAWSQVQLSGKIIEEETGIAVPNAYVFLENTKYGTLTDANGNFLIRDVPMGSAQLVVSSTGNITINEGIEVTEDKYLEFSVQENIQSLPQLVIESQTLSLGRVGQQEIPGSVHYISSKTLDKHNYTNVNDLLKMVPGVNIQEEDGFGLRPNIGLRGSGLERSARVTLMEDGILAAPAPYSSPSAYYFPTIGRMNGVEVLKGSSQIRFGPFTTGGAINFLSTPIPNRFSTRFKMIGGSYGFRNLHASVGNSYDQVGFLVEAFQYGAGGFKELSNDGNTGFIKNDYQVKLRLSTRPDAQIYQSLNFTLGQTTEDSNETYLGLSLEDFDENPYQRYAASQFDNMVASQNRFNIQHYLEIPGWFNVVTTAYSNQFERNWYKLQGVSGGPSLNTILSDPTQYASQMNLLRGSSNSDSVSMIVRANNREYLSQGVQTVFDIEFETGVISHDIHVSGRIHRDEEDRFQWEDGYAINQGQMKLVDPGTPGSHANRIESAEAFAGYILYKLSIGDLNFIPGLRYEDVTISRENYGTEDLNRSGTSLSTRSNRVSAWLPGLGINYNINEQLNAFIGAHKGFAPPGSNPENKAESSANYEIGLRRTRSLISGSLVLFYTDYQNLLGQDNASAGGIGSGNVFNAGTAFTRGIELEGGLDLLALKTSSWGIPFNINYSFTDAEFSSSFESDFDAWGTVSSGDNLPYIARHQVATSLGVQNQRIGLFLNMKYQSDVRTIPGQGKVSGIESIPEFFIMDFSSSVYLNRFTSFTLSVNNLLDNQYAVAARPAGLRPGMPRAFNFGVNVRF